MFNEFPDEKIVNRLRSLYPNGTRIVLEKMPRSTGPIAANSSASGCISPILYNTRQADRGQGQNKTTAPQIVRKSRNCPS